MAESYKDRHVRCYFGILNLKGLMDTDNEVIKDAYGVGIDAEMYGEVRLPLFSHETYKIKTTFNKNLSYSDTYEYRYNMNGQQQRVKRNTAHFGTAYFGDMTTIYHGKYYQKRFRRQVLWDFGDGTKIEGYSAEHAYKKPGRYKITCTFFDINRQAWVNDYCIYVVVKEVLPTTISFYQPKTEKQEIFCSKIERIATLQATLSNTVNQQLEIVAKRIFSEEEHNTIKEQIDSKFDKLPKVPFRFMKRCWSLFENIQELYYNSQEVYMNNIQPTDRFHPEYQQIYGKFYYNEIKDEIDFTAYQVIPYKNIDKKLKSITIIDPNKRIIPQDKKNPTEEHYKVFSVTQAYIPQGIPEGHISIGKRGFCEVYYKNDFVTSNNIFSFFYDIENVNITGELQSADNYLNINPLGLNVGIKNNNISSIKLGMSLDGFIREVEDSDDIMNENGYYIDPHLKNSLIKGVDMDTYVFPYIPYQNWQGYIVGDTELEVQGDGDVFVPMMGGYYIPKDVVLYVKGQRKLHNKFGYGSIINTGIQLNEDGSITEFGEGQYMQAMYAWLYRIPLILRDYIDIDFHVDYSIEKAWGENVITLRKLPMLNTNSVVIPKEIQWKENIDRLLDVYMSHPMFNQTQNAKEMFKLYLGNGFLNYIMTRSNNFLDDNVNIKTCHLSKLIATLKMMGEDVTEFEKGSFEGINDLRDFVRLLSINHSELVGHVIHSNLDISVKGDIKGKNVGANIDIQDRLYLNNNSSSEHLGKVTGFRRKNSEVDSILNLNMSSFTENGLDIIVHDRYTNDTKIVSFMNMQKGRTNPISSVTISDYQDWWDWNLLLPDRFNAARKKQHEYETRANNGDYSTSKREFYRSEAKRMKEICSNMLDGYYSFYILDPRREDIRQGNFIDDAYITSRIENHQTWGEIWGITHEILMKIMYENGQLFNGRTYAYQEVETEEEEEPRDQYVTEGQVYLTREYEQGEIIYNIYVNGENDPSMKVTGSVQLKGTIIGEGNNTLVLSLDNGLVDDVFAFKNYDAPRSVHIKVKGTGDIEPTEEVFYLTGDNIQGFLTVKVSGTVENPWMTVSSTINFIDKRVEPISIDTIYYNDSKFYTNLRRQDIQSSVIDDGLVEWGDSDTAHKIFNLNIRWEENTPQIGKNKVYISVDYDMGNLYYRQKDSYDNSAFAENYQIGIKEHPVNLIIQNDGSIYMENEWQEFEYKIEQPTYMIGKIRMRVTGNVMAEEKPKLECYAEGMRRILADVGGYYYKVTSSTNDAQKFLINGQDGFDNGYYFVISSEGTEVHMPSDYKNYEAEERIEIYNSNNEKVYTMISPKRTMNVKVDEYARLTQDSFVNYYDQGEVLIDTFGSYYTIGAYDIRVKINN